MYQLYDTESLGPGPNIQASRGRDTGVCIYRCPCLAWRFGPEPWLLFLCGFGVLFYSNSTRKRWFIVL